jgi:serine/threonine protein kinase
MNDDAENERLLALANAIAQGDEISWAAETHQAAGGDAALIGALKSLEEIAEAQRRLHESPAIELTHWASFTILERLETNLPWTTYRARDPGLAKDVLLLLAGPLGGDPSTVEQLLRDARRQTALHHPHVATVYGADYAQDYVGLWMESLPGQTLEAWVQSSGPRDASEASAIVRDLCSAVDAFHHAGLVHGGIGPRTIIRGDDQRIVLTATLGASAFALPRSAPRAHQTDRAKPPSNAADIRALGVALHFLLTGRDPESADGSDATRAATRAPRRLAAIVARTTTRDAAERFTTASELEAALQKASRSGRIGWEWIVGFAIAALVTALIMWLTATSATH